MSDTDWLFTIYGYMVVIVLLVYVVNRFERMVSLCKQIRNYVINVETSSFTYASPKQSKTENFVWQKNKKHSKKGKKK